MNLRLISSKH